MKQSDSSMILITQLIYHDSLVTSPNPQAEQKIKEARGFLKKSHFSTHQYFQMKHEEKN